MASRRARDIECETIALQVLLSPEASTPLPPTSAMGREVVAWVREQFTQRACDAALSAMVDASPRSDATLWYADAAMRAALLAHPTIVKTLVDDAARKINECRASQSLIAKRIAPIGDVLMLKRFARFMAELLHALLLVSRGERDLTYRRSPDAPLLCVEEESACAVQVADARRKLLENPPLTREEQAARAGTLARTFLGHMGESLSTHPIDGRAEDEIGREFAARLLALIEVRVTGNVVRDLGVLFGRRDSPCTTMHGYVLRSLSSPFRPSAALLEAAALLEKDPCRRRTLEQSAREGGNRRLDEVYTGELGREAVREIVRRAHLACGTAVAERAESSGDGELTSGWCILL